MISGRAQRLFDALAARPIPEGTVAELVASDSPVLIEIVSATLRAGTPGAGWYLGGICERLPVTALEDLAAQAVRYRSSGPNKAADDVIADVSVQHPAALTAYLPVLWDLAPNQNTYYAEWPWRAAGGGEIARLLDIAQAGRPGAGRARDCLLQTRRPDDSQLACGKRGNHLPDEVSRRPVRCRGACPYTGWPRFRAAVRPRSPSQNSAAKHDSGQPRKGDYLWHGAGGHQCRVVGAVCGLPALRRRSLQLRLLVEAGLRHLPAALDLRVLPWNGLQPAASGRERLGCGQLIVTAVIRSEPGLPGHMCCPRCAAVPTAKDSTNGQPVSRGLRFRSSRLQRPAYSHG
jgi:hypothetical protein